MNKIKTIIMVLLIVGLPLSAWSQSVSKEQVKGLDEQVQDIKKDVLSISAELSLLEEKLLFPSNTQVSIFVSVHKGVQYTPDAVQIKVDDNRLSLHNIEPSRGSLGFNFM